MTCSSTKNAVGQRGVTLLELLAVLAVISLAVVLFAPMQAQIAERAAPAREATLLAAALRNAQADAVAQGAVIDFQINVDTGEIGETGKPPVSVPSTRRIRFTGARELMTAQQSGVIRLYPDGSASGGVIEIEAARETNRIAVDWLTGAVTTERIRK